MTARVKWKWILVCLLIVSALSSGQTSYNWPTPPFDQPHWINGTFCENRPNGSIERDHFHDGVDIHLPQNGNVYSVINGTVTSIGTAAQYGINAYVRVGRYAYVHVDAVPGLQVGDAVTAFQTIIGKTNSWNHIHFKDGYPGSETNALRENGGFTPFNDNLLPNVHWTKFYVNGTTVQFPSNRLNGKVDIVVRASDVTDNGPLGGNNGIFKIGYQVFDSSGTNALAPEVVNFVFDIIPATDDYITNVYFPGSDISTYLYTVTNRINHNSSWDTRQLAHGAYQVKTFTEDTYGNRDEMWTPVIVEAQDNYPPAVPELLFARAQGTANWELGWLPNDSTDINGYDFYFSYDAQTWSNQQGISDALTAESTSWLQQGFPQNTTIYFRLQAYDNASIPNISDFSSEYALRISNSGPKVLIVDAFHRRDGYWQQAGHAFAVEYAKMLTDWNIAFDTASNLALRDSSVQLSNYETVIYFAGDENSRALDVVEQSMIAAYLQNGGQLLISGSDLAGHLGQSGSAADSTFLHDYLRSTFSGKTGTAGEISGESGTAFSGLLGTLSPDTINCDQLTAVNSQPIARFASGQIAGVAYSGPFPSAVQSGKIVYYSFPAEALAGYQQRKDFTGKALDYFGLVNSIASNSTPVYSLHLYQNYPNPFNPQTRIRFSLPASGTAKIQIINVFGQIIAEPLNMPLSAGTHDVLWDGKTPGGQVAASGVYFYRLDFEGQSRTGKLILLR